ncbi:hypothetical protein F1880_001197 [Penicillium rolfsii]|nr:hypothetical protein F1880_001197 [Penicillium rolfsii]
MIPWYVQFMPESTWIAGLPVENMGSGELRETSIPRKLKKLRPFSGQGLLFFPANQFLFSQRCTPPRNP